MEERGRTIAPVNQGRLETRLEARGFRVRHAKLFHIVVVYVNAAITTVSMGRRQTCDLSLKNDIYTFI